MRVFRVCLVAVLSGFSFLSTAQNLIINEVSQGVSGTQEYVEFVVAGIPPGCSGTIPTQDLRRIIIDDNNGTFQPGSGSGIAPGALRFANIPFWQAIPQGTIIVVYNESDRGAAIPPDDLTMADGNGLLIIPSNSALFEGQGVSPTNADNTYPTTDAGWTAGGGQWSYLGMANGGDSFQIRQTASSANPFFSVSWGTNTAPAGMIYFSGSASGQVFFCGATPTQAGWSSGAAASFQTPGTPNNPANAAMITAFTTGGTGGLQVALSTDNESCFNACDGSVEAQVTGGVAPFSYAWNVAAGNVATLANRCPGSYSVTVTDDNGCTGNAQTTIQAATQLTVSATSTNESCQAECDGTATLNITGANGEFTVSWDNGGLTTNLNDLCPGSYEATVTDDNGCTATASTSVSAGPSIGSPAFITTGPFDPASAPVQLVNQTAGGTYSTAECSGCLTASGVFSPAVAGSGTYTICYTLTNGSCTATDCADFVVNGCTTQETEETVQICEGDSLLIFGNWELQADIYAHTYQNINGCDSTHRVTLTFYVNPDQNVAFSFCEGDSVNVFGEWIDSAGIYTRELQSVQGCTYTQFITVTEGFCAPEPIIYIPNVFTPNNDFTNDVFKIELIGGMVEEGFIFNRWGHIIAQFDANNISWDGKNENGEMMEDGVYTYLVRYSSLSGISDEVHGHVTLIR